MIRETSNERIASASVTKEKRKRRRVSAYPGAQQPQEHNVPGAQQPQAHANGEIVTQTRRKLQTEEGEYLSPIPEGKRGA